MNTKMLSLLLCFVMLVGLMPTTALAADTYTITLNSPTEAYSGLPYGGYAHGSRH